MVYATKTVYRNNKCFWECNYEGALQSIEMARVWLSLLCKVENACESLHFYFYELRAPSRHSGMDHGNV